VAIKICYRVPFYYEGKYFTDGSSGHSARISTVALPARVWLRISSEKNVVSNRNKIEHCNSRILAPNADGPRGYNMIATNPQSKNDATH
jgi:hypothetical protein